MNANELADKLEGTAKFINNISNQYHAVREVKEAATMLRQQQAEIEAVKESNKNLMELVTMLREEVNSLRPYKEKIEAMERTYEKHFEAALRADDVWKRATGKKP